MSLVADYGDSSESTTGSDSDSSTHTSSPFVAEQPSTTNQADKLPTPDFAGTSGATLQSVGSVFTNPFKEAENAKQAILEKHVKMINTQDNIRIINGKKVCWNYRKGRCRFGHNCVYAHDSDIQKSAEQLELEKQIQKTVLYQNQQQKPQVSAKAELNDCPKPIDENKPKKRPGLTQGLVPGKKVMKAYQKQNSKLTSH